MSSSLAWSTPTHMKRDPCCQLKGGFIHLQHQMSQHPLQKPESRKTRTTQQPEHEDVLTKRKGGGL